MKLGAAFEVTFDPGSLRLYTISHSIFAWNLVSEGRKQVWRRGWKAHPFKRPSSIRASPDGRHLVAKSTFGELAGLDAATGQVLWIRKPKHRDEGPGAVFVGDGSFLHAGWDGRVERVSTASGELQAHASGPRVGQLCHSVGGVLMTHGWLPPDEGSSAPPEHIMRVDAVTLAATQAGHKRLIVRAMMPSPNGKRLAINFGTPQFRLDIIELDGEGVVSAEMDFRPYGLCWSPDGRQLCATVSEGHMLLDTSTLDVLKFWPGAYASACAFSPDGEWLALGRWGPGEIIRVAR